MTHGTPAKFEPYPVRKRANAQAVEKLQDLLEQAEKGEIVSFAWAVDNGHEISTGFTSSDNILQLAGAVTRLTYQIQLALDEQYGEP